MTSNKAWRLALTEAELEFGWLFTLDIPPPTTPTYEDYTERIAQGEGGVATLGYARAEWLWTNVIPTTTFLIKDLVRQALLFSDKRIFVTLDRSNGTGPGRDWVDVSAVPQLPTQTMGGPQSGASNAFHSQVTLVLNNIQIINDPSTVV